MSSVTQASAWMIAGGLWFALCVWLSDRYLSPRVKSRDAQLTWRELEERRRKREETARRDRQEVDHLRDVLQIRPGVYVKGGDDS